MKYELGIVVDTPLYGRGRKRGIMIPPAVIHLRNCEPRGKENVENISSVSHQSSPRAAADFINEMLRDIVPRLAEETFAISSNIGSRCIIILKRYTAAINYTRLLCIRNLPYVLTQPTMLARRLPTNYTSIQKAAPRCLLLFLKIPVFSSSIDLAAHNGFVVNNFSSNISRRRQIKLLALGSLTRLV